MKNMLKTFAIGGILMLVVANIFLFASSIGISDEISNFEHQGQVLHEQNLSLEKQVSKLTSLEFAKEKAKELDFTATANPTTLPKLGVAYRYNP